MKNYYKFFRFQTIDNRVRRGCMSDLESDDLQKCILGVGRYCKMCNEVNCNKKAKPQECLQCDSRYDANCYNNTDSVHTTECENYHDKCATIFKDDKKTVRDCLKKLVHYDAECVDNRFDCYPCEAPNCNQILQNSGQLCYECDAEVDPNCMNRVNNSMLTICPEFEGKNLGCFHSNYYARE